MDSNQWLSLFFAEMERLVDKLNDNNTADDIYLQEIYNNGGFLERSYQQIHKRPPEGSLAKTFEPDDAIDIADTPVESFCDESGIYPFAYRNQDYWTGKHYASIDNRGRPLDAEMRAISGSWMKALGDWRGGRWNDIPERRAWGDENCQGIVNQLGVRLGNWRGLGNWGWNDDAGHLIAYQMGGFGRRLNLVPQINNLNRSNFRWAIEQPIVDCVMKRNTIVWYRVTPEYANNTTLRPSSFAVNYSIVKPSVALSVVPWRVALGTLLSLVPTGSEFTVENHVGPIPQQSEDTMNRHRDIIRALCR